MAIEIGQFIIRTRRATEAEWNAAGSPILALGEEGLEIDTLRYKVGDGLTGWDLLPYWTELTRVKQVATDTYSLTAADNNTILICTNAVSCTITMPNFTIEPMPIGFICHAHQDAAGTVELVAASGVSTRAAIGLKTRVLYSSLSIIYQAQNVYKIIGDAKS
jgi:hypothetical protein